MRGFIKKIKLKTIIFIVLYTAFIIGLTLLTIFLLRENMPRSDKFFELSISVLTDFVGVILSAALAYYIAYIQLNNEKKRLLNDKNIDLINKLTILLNEINQNKKIVNLALEERITETETVFIKISVKDWETLKFSIIFSETEFELVNGVYKYYYILKDASELEKERLDTLNDKLKQASNIIEKKINNLRNEMD